MCCHVMSVEEEERESRAVKLPALDHSRREEGVVQLDLNQSPSQCLEHLPPCGALHEGWWLLNRYLRNRRAKRGNHPSL